MGFTLTVPASNHGPNEVPYPAAFERAKTFSKMLLRRLSDGKHNFILEMGAMVAITELVCQLRMYTRLEAPFSSAPNSDTLSWWRALSESKLKSTKKQVADLMADGGSSEDEDDDQDDNRRATERNPTFDLDSDIDLESPFLQSMISDTQIPTSERVSTPAVTAGPVHSEMKDYESTEDDGDEVSVSLPTRLLLELAFVVSASGSLILVPEPGDPSAGEWDRFRREFSAPWNLHVPSGFLKNIFIGVFEVTFGMEGGRGAAGNSEPMLENPNARDCSKNGTVVECHLEVVERVI